nr:MAG TPA: hypothetical protein [Caudoviricetes sp.]
MYRTWYYFTVEFYGKRNTMKKLLFLLNLSIH